ncbi:MAG: hypothetical protein REI78_13330 [Pedobacter sp.]|nr:hypothetical protein [Pedobacter sp.]
MLVIACGRTEKAPDSTQKHNHDVTDSVARNTVPASIQEIKALFATTINQLSMGKLDSTVLTYDCAGERSGTITYFTESGNLRLIRHRYSEYSHYTAEDEYFVSDEKLYFAFLHGVSWSFVSDGATKDDHLEQRIYLANNKPIQCLEKKYAVQTGQTKTPNAVNRRVDCKPVAPLLKKFEQLLNFRKVKRDCLS